jgi:hypothetical protein
MEPDLSASLNMAACAWIAIPCATLEHISQGDPLKVAAL